jgi:low affinity Fe/Cu permease
VPSTAIPKSIPAIVFFIINVFLCTMTTSLVNHGFNNVVVVLSPDTLKI